MSDAPEQEASHCDMDHGLGAIDALLIVSHEAAPACHPSEGTLDDPAAGKDLEALRRIGPPDDFDGEVEEGGLVHELGAVVGTIREQMLEPWPALAHAVEDHLGAGTVGNIGGGEVYHQKATVGIDGDVALAPDDFLARVVTPCFCMRSLDRLAVDDPARGARLTSAPFAVEHQRHVVDGLEQEAPDEPAEPPVDGLPGRKILRQHPPAAAGAGQISDRIQNLAQIRFNRPPALGHTRQERFNPCPLFVGQIRRVALRLLRNLGHPATRRWGPHPQLESRNSKPCNRLSNGLSAKTFWLYSVGHIGRETRHDLEMIRLVRNETAHNPNPVAFSVAAIKTRCLSIKISESLVKGPDARPRFVAAVSALAIAFSIKSLHAKNIPYEQNPAMGVIIIADLFKQLAS